MHTFHASLAHRCLSTKRASPRKDMIYHFFRAIHCMCGRANYHTRIDQMIPMQQHDILPYYYVHNLLDFCYTSEIVPCHLY